MMKKLMSLFISLFCCLVLPSITQAKSDYVLPYPSLMPGHKFYPIYQIFTQIQDYWSFGNLSQFQYHLKMADKFLVEAKTLFEYEQYLLGSLSLPKSNLHLKKAALFLRKASQENKEVSQKEVLFKNACQKHREFLDQLLKELPSEILWQEEKKAAVSLKIKKLIEEAKNTIPE